MTDLPKGWTKAEISALVEPQQNGKPFQQGWSPQCESRPATHGKWGVLKTTAIQHGEFWSHENKALPAHLTPRPHIEVKQGDILMTCAGPRNRCGVACIVETTQSKLMMSGKMYRFRPHPAVLNSRFLSYFIRMSDTQKLIDEMKTGISDSGLNLTHSRFGKLSVVVPPLSEQDRIVKKIEASFDEIDRGVDSLRDAKRTIELYRQSMLKSAFEGRLTADWRARNPDKLESPASLLLRIREEREKHYRATVDEWEQAVLKWSQGGAGGRRPRKPKEPPDLKVSSHTNQAPSGWVTLPLELLGRIETGATPSKNVTANYGGDVPFFKPTDLDAGDDVRECREFLSELGASRSRRFRSGTVLVTCIGATIGKTGLATVDGTCNQQINFLDPYDYIEPKFMYFQVKSPQFQDMIRHNASATTLPILNRKKFSLLPARICSFSEQKEVVRLLDSHLVAAESLDKEINANFARAETLRQTILKQAFSGQLLPQDASDEPASALLTRMKAERDTVPSKRSGKRIEA